MAIFLHLAQDLSRAVRQSALQQLGAFIVTLPMQDEVRQKETIISHYCSMINEPTGDLAVDSALKQSCVYYFPGVFQCLGISKWNQLKEVIRN